MKKRRFPSKVAFALLLILAAGMLLPSLIPCPNLDSDLTFSQIVVDRDGRLLRIGLASDGKYRIRVHAKDLPAGLIDSILLHEDQSFAKHRGVDFTAIFRALLQRTAGRSESGASTITMQLARMRFGIRSHTWMGKVEQAFRAMQLERRYSKEELLESYLNRASYGSNIEGIAAASLIYFGRMPGELTQAEWDVLALIPQRPGARGRSTAGVEPPDLFEARQRLASRRNNSGAELTPLYFERNLPFEAPHLVTRLQGEETSAVIQSTIDLRYQHALEEEMRKAIRAARKNGVCNAAALLADYRSGETISYVGSADFWSREIQGQVDGVCMRRSPGSTVKPFVYAAALQEGLIHPGSLIADSPISLGSYKPENFDKKFEGRMRVGSALVQSRNIPAVLLASRLHSTTRARFLTWLESRQKEEAGAGIAVGGFETSMEKLAYLWSALANRGEARPLCFVKKSEAQIRHRLFSREASFLVLNMLAAEENFHPLLPRGAPIAWKTGTSQGFRDAWCCAVFDRYVLCVWMGAFDGKPNPALIGREMAAPLLFRMVSRIRQLSPQDPDWIGTGEEANLERAEVCQETGLLCGPECKHRRTEWFWPGVSPVARCSHALSVRNDGPLQIESPAASVRYVSERQSNRGIPLKSSGAQSRIYWFNGTHFLGSAQSGEPVWWRPQPGSYRLLAVDESGQSVCREVEVIGL